MSFASRFPTVARLLSSTAGTGAQEQQDPPADPPANEEQDPPAEEQDPPAEEQEPAGDDNQAALRAAFTRDANAQVNAERERCVAVFTSEGGKRNPDAAARLLKESGMASAGIIGVLDTVGGSAPGGGSRQQHRDRINQSRESRPETGASEDQQTGVESTVAAHKEARKARNEKAEKKGQVRSGRTQFDD